MKSVDVNGVQLAYDVTGAGEPVLFISPVVADGFLPLVAEPVLADHHLLIRYHKRGWAGSTHTPPPVTVADHAADAAALLDRLGVRRAHVVGHSTGASAAAQLALDHPGCVHTLTLMEPEVMGLPSGKAFLEQARPVFEAYGNGDPAGALVMFMEAVSGLDRATCEALFERRVPGAIAQAVEDADTCFGIELPALTQWEFGVEQAAAVHRPTLSVRGAETLPFFVDVAGFLRESLPDVEETVIDGVGHLLQIQRPEPVARAVAGFLDRHPLEPSLSVAGGMLDV